MNILDILTADSVRVPLVATDKQGAILELVDVLADAGRISNGDKLKEIVWERETQRSTGIGEGLAIPHGKCDCSKQLVMAVGVPAEPLEFGSIDKKPVRLIALLCSPPDKTADHIQALGKISRLMSDTGFREQAYGAQTGEELFGLFEKTEG